MILAQKTFLMVRIQEMHVKLAHNSCGELPLREPTHPGEMLLEEFLVPMGISQKQLADAMQVPFQRVNEIVNRRRGVTPETALRLSKVLGMSPSFWLKLQMAWDLYHEQQDKQFLIDAIPYKPFAKEHHDEILSA
ncbi:MAG: HigA family addiction module antitoxin [Caldilineaceae bacterium]